MDTDLQLQILDLQPGAHLYLFYDRDPAEQMPALVPFIEEGLAHNDKCFYIADDQTTQQVADSLESGGIRANHERARRSLELWTRSEWRQPGARNLKKKSVRVLSMIQSARDSGFDGIRFTIEMTWTLGPDITAGRLKYWEAAHSNSNGTPGRLCLCQRDRVESRPGEGSVFTVRLPLPEAGRNRSPN